MGLREAIQKRQMLLGGISTALVVVAVLLIIRQLMLSARGDLPVFPDKAFFTSDDGATWFVDSEAKIPPFISDGREAVRANVFTSDGGKHKWVQYLEKYTDAAQAALQQQALGHPIATGQPGPLSGKLVKRPGDKSWVLTSDPASHDIMDPKPSDGGSSAVVEPVLP